MDAERRTSDSNEALKDAIIEGHYDKVNAYVTEAQSVTEFLRPLRASHLTDSDGDEEQKSVHPFDLAIRHGQFRILRALIDHAIRETGVEIFVDILLNSNLMELEVVFMDLVQRYPVAAHFLLDSYVKYVRLNGHPVFKEALTLNPDLILNPKVIKRMAKLERTELLRHPLIGTYLAAKWKDFAWIYYLGLSFQILSALVVTSYALIRTHESSGLDPNIGQTFWVVGILLTSLRALYMVLDASRSIIEHRRVLFRPFVILKEGIFLGLVFGGLISEGSVSRELQARATIISWMRLFLSVSSIPDWRCLYVRAFKSVIRVAIFEAGIASGIFFPLIGLLLGFYIMSEKGTVQSFESLGIFVFLVIFSIAVLTYLMGHSVAKVRDEVLSGEDFIRQQKALFVNKYQKLVSFWSRICSCQQPLSSSSTFIILPRQFNREEEDKSMEKKVVGRILSRLKRSSSDLFLPIYIQINNGPSEPLDYNNIQESKYEVPSSIVEAVAHPMTTDSGHTILYWNNGYEAYYKGSRFGEVQRKMNSDEDYEIVEPRTRTKYQLLREAILTEIKRDYGPPPVKKDEEPSVSVRPGLALGLITLQAGSMGQSQIKLNHH